VLTLAERRWSVWPRDAYGSSRSAWMDTRVSVCALAQYPAHGSVLRRRSRCGTVFSVHRSGPLRSSRQSSGTDTGAPARARGENAETDVFVRLLRR
jgi:hypothetical protein